MAKKLTPHKNAVIRRDAQAVAVSVATRYRFRGDKIIGSSPGTKRLCVTDCDRQKHVFILTKKLLRTLALEACAASDRVFSKAVF